MVCVFSRMGAGRLSSLSLRVALLVNGGDKGGELLGSVLK